MTQFVYSLPNGIQNELIVELWVFPLSSNTDISSTTLGSTTYTIWGITNSNNFQLDFTITSSAMSLFGNSNVLTTMSSAFTANKWIFLQAGISYSMLSTILNNSITSVAIVSAIPTANVSIVPSSLDNFSLILTKNYLGYIRNFRIWYDFINHPSYFSNRHNSPKPTFFFVNNQIINRLLVSIPANHSGRTIYDEMNYISPNPGDIAGEYSSNYSIPGNSKYKLTNYVLRTLSSNNLLICEGDTVYDSSTNSCILSSNFSYNFSC
jgi:hypothetical protein